MNHNKHSEAVIALFTDWETTPEVEREPQTIDEYSKDNGIPLATLYTWRKALEKEPDLSDIESFERMVFEKAPAKVGYAELWAKMHKLTGDKALTEELPVLTADDYHLIEQQARRENDRGDLPNWGAPGQGSQLQNDEREEMFDKINK